MKVYELMSLLEDEPAGAEVRVGITITRKELEGGNEIESGLYSHNLSVDSIDGDANKVWISTNAPGR